MGREKNGREASYKVGDCRSMVWTKWESRFASREVRGHRVQSFVQWISDRSARPEFQLEFR